MLDAATPSTRVRAAETVLTQAAKAIEMEDIDARVSELERAAWKPSQGGHDDQKSNSAATALGRAASAGGGA
jgi:hypothetical protein